jgi:hypothetical protein
MKSLGLNINAVLISLTAHGSEIISVDRQIKTTALYRLGLSFTLSRALADALNQLYGRKYHGREQQKSKTGYSVKPTRRRARSRFTR